MASAYKDTARVFKAFCDENRLQILEMLRSGEKCACKLLEVWFTCRRNRSRNHSTK